ncbi:hypothetical protein BCR32DRAFT_281046 [Anaeromyces robustus]|uniref:Uncharacterized protein n=1 Tax=Anaeromyces robustus TaxID=1754192 RepID=A0A1Y1X249_9FUNG|nr:hypothetical protein BCR32DRAFT_281046 [Anaeromyces robustus]|eukprot:ORX79853.1 hypothetical protein BCR32DRAFT_281046 [Anaeromyces robustus]
MKFFHLLFFVVIICTLQWETQRNFVNAAKTPENTYFPRNGEGYSTYYNPLSKKINNVFFLNKSLVFDLKQYPLTRCRFNPENMAIYCEFKDKRESYRVKFFVNSKSVTCFPTENNFLSVETINGELGYIPPFHRITGSEIYSKTIKLHSKSCTFNAEIYSFYITRI